MFQAKKEGSKKIYWWAWASAGRGKTGIPPWKMGL